VRRFLVVLLMVLLLPLRGMAAELMAVDRAAAQVETAAAAPCSLHAAAAADDGALGADNACQACDLCLPLAELPATALVVPAAARHAKPVCHAATAHGTVAAPTFKPPIS
jgi:hypothetical protein